VQTRQVGTIGRSIVARHLLTGLSKKTAAASITNKTNTNFNISSTEREKRKGVVDQVADEFSHACCLYRLAK
jgi:hypothetical protein